MKKIALLLFLSLYTIYSYPANPIQQQLVHLFNAGTISSLSEALFDEKHPENGHQYPQSPISFDQLYAQVRLFGHNQKKSLDNPAVWLHTHNPFSAEAFNISKSQFKPFAQKVVLPQGSKVIFFGDLHGNIHSLLRILKHLKDAHIIDNQFNIIDQNYYFMFLGDYVDRGSYGAEVIFALLRLKNNNPHHVFMVRGNHEDCQLNSHFGFAQELKEKFSTVPASTINQLYSMYDLMPAVIYLGISNGSQTDFIQCCHGGLDLGYNAKELLHSSATCQAILELNRSSAFQILPRNIKDAIINTVPKDEITTFVPLQPTTPLTLGLLWHDFIESASNYTNNLVGYITGRGWVYGQELTSRLLDQASSSNVKLRAIFRAHQHHGGMLDLLRKQKGIVSLWDGMVHTFLSAPVYRVNFPYDSFGILHINSSYQSSTLEHTVI